MLHAEQPVAAKAVNDRMAALRALASEKSIAHRTGFVGKQLEAITLHTPSEIASANRTLALTENFLPVELEGQLPANSLIRLRVSGLNAEGTLQAAGMNLE
jgi:tRNA A37 methylthiotransferase MiaB